MALSQTSNALAAPAVTRVCGELFALTNAKKSGPDASTPLQGNQTQVLDALRVLKSETADTASRIRAVETLGNLAVADDSTMATLFTSLKIVSNTAGNQTRAAVIAHDTAIKSIIARSGSYPKRVQKPSFPGIREKLLSAPIATIMPFPHGKKEHYNAVYIVAFKDGTRGVFKPLLEQKALHEVPDEWVADWVSASREVVADDLIEDVLGNRKARAKGFSRLFVPEIVEVALIHDGKNFGYGTLSNFAGRTVPLSKLNANTELTKIIRSSRAWRQNEARIRIFDYVMGNPDRLANKGIRDPFVGENDENVLVRMPIGYEINTPAGVERVLNLLKKPENVEKFVEQIEVGLIDNSIGMPGFPEHDYRHLPRFTEFPDDLSQTLRNFDAKKFVAAFKNRLPKRGIDDITTRVEQLKKLLPLKHLPMERYFGLSSDQKRALNWQIYEANLALSRTASLGVSIKKFDLPPEQVLKIARDNALEAFDVIYEMASRDISKISVEEFARWIRVELNARFTEKLASTTPGDIKVRGESGELRKYSIPGEDPSFAAGMDHHFMQLVQDLHTALQKPNFDPFSLASITHVNVASGIKPFHDGGGRTARALVDLIFLKAGYPLPKYAGKTYMSEDGRLQGDYVNALNADFRGLENYLRLSIADSLQLAPQAPAKRAGGF